MSAQKTKKIMSRITSNLLNTFQHPKEKEETTLTILDTEDERSNQNKDINTDHTDPNSTAINVSYSVPWNNRLASISEMKISKENLNNLAKLLYVTHNDNKSFLQDMQNIEFEHIFNKLKTETSKRYKIEKGLLYKNVNNNYKLMLPHQIL